MNKTIKTAAAALTLALLGVFWVDKAHAANPDTFTLTVTIGNALSVTVRNGTDGDRPDYNFETMNYGDVSINRDDIRIDNDGGITSTYELQIADTGVGLTLRTDTAALANNEYRVQALFQDVQPGHADFSDPTVDADDTLTTTAKAAQVTGTGSQFSKDAGTSAAEDGVAVAADDRLTGSIAEVRLWLRLELAASGDVTGLQTGFATVIVNAI